MQQTANWMPDVTVLAAMGMAGMLHCAGMCGGLAILAAAAGRGRKAQALLLYLAGKTSAYLFLGAAAGALGGTVVRTAPVQWGGRLLALGTAALLAAVAAEVLGWLRLPAAGLAWLRDAAARAGALAREGGWQGSVVFGFVNGLLPCPMVYAFVAAGAATASPLGGTAAMAILAVTSAVPLSLTACASRPVGRWAGGWAPRAAALLMLVMAAATVYRAFAPAAAHHMPGGGHAHTSMR